MDWVVWAVVDRYRLKQPTGPTPTNRPSQSSPKRIGAHAGCAIIATPIPTSKDPTRRNTHEAFGRSSRSITNVRPTIHAALAMPTAIANSMSGQQRRIRSMACALPRSNARPELATTGNS